MTVTNMRLFKHAPSASASSALHSGVVGLPRPAGRISVAVHKAVAKELSDALGFSGAVDPRGVPRD